MKLTIYVGHQITGLSYDYVIKYFKDIKERLEDIGFDVLHAMVAKEYLKNDNCLKSHGYHHPTATDHAIGRRDRWMTTKADIVLIDFTDTNVASIGCSCELTIAYHEGKHTVTVLPKDNIHEHAFIREFSDVVFFTLEEATEYLGKLIKGEA